MGAFSIIFSFREVQHYHDLFFGGEKVMNVSGRIFITPAQLFSIFLQFSEGGLFDVIRTQLSFQHFSFFSSFTFHVKRHKKLSFHIFIKCLEGSAFGAYNRSVSSKNSLLKPLSTLALTALISKHQCSWYLG